MFSPEILLRISKQVSAAVSRVETTLKFLDEGATVPFIARYRKEATGNLDEVKVRDIDESRQYYKDLENRRATILASIEKQGKLTDELKAKILASYNRSELEDLYLPFKPKKKTKASVALERGLEPLANYVWEQAGTDPIDAFAQQFVNVEKEIPTPDAAIEGALHIVAERIAENPEFRKQLRERLLDGREVRAKVRRGRNPKRRSTRCTTTSRRQFPKSRRIECWPSVAARARSVLHYSIDIDSEKSLASLIPQVIRDGHPSLHLSLRRAVRDSYERLLLPSIQNEVRSIAGTSGIRSHPSL